jgi:outer membrane immunogenic protein
MDFLPDKLSSRQRLFLSKTAVSSVGRQQRGWHMRKSKTTSCVVSVASAVLGIGAATAADMPFKAPTLARVAIYDWTGFYVGANAGVGIGRDYTRLAVPDGGSFEASYLNPQGFVGGGQIGFNWQVPNVLFGALVFGVEADIQGTGMRDNLNCLLGCLPTLNANFSQTLDWFGTVRGRVGIATGPVLSYVTGGYAYGSVKTTLTETVFAPAAAFSSNQNRGGWTYGSGVEASLGGNWTGKIEYLYVDLGDRVDNFVLSGFAHTVNTEVREHIFRVGLNYRVAGNGAAYVPPPASNWAGFYIGVNIGYGIGRDRNSLAVTSAGNSTELFNLSPAGINGGVQAGYNWQAANWVLGLEADIQGSSQRDNRACVQTCNPLGLAGGPIQFFAYDARLPWFGTVRGRVGYSVGPTLLYATGGLAYGSVNTKISAAFANVPGSAEFSNVRTGWTVGGGIETPFTVLVGVLGNNWTAKTEYLYVDLGTSTGSFTIPVGGAVVTATNSTRVQEHIFRAGLNYHFNSPVVARY